VIEGRFLELEILSGWTWLCVPALQIDGVGAFDKDGRRCMGSQSSMSACTPDRLDAFERQNEICVEESCIVFKGMLIVQGRSKPG
jgi:hypothetical protein